jgi:hypothetical protein
MTAVERKRSSPRLRRTTKKRGAVVKRKYITYEHVEGYSDYVVFGPITNHDDMASRLSAIKIYGAGFLSFGEEGACCYGESVSMNIMSRGDKDEKIINRGSL